MVNTAGLLLLGTTGAAIALGVGWIFMYALVVLVEGIK